MRSKALRRVAPCLLTPVLAGLTATAGQTERKSASSVAEIILKEHQQEMLDGHVELLRSYPGFDSADGVARLPPWTYATTSDPSLTRMSEQYRLKEIAGQGSEVGRFLRLMEWAHRITEGRGDLGDPDALNTPAIIGFVRSRVEKQRDGIVQFMREICAIPSMDSQLREVGERNALEMKGLGFEGVRFDKMGNILGRIGGGKRTIVRFAH